MGNVNIGSGNISKKIGYSITDEQLEKISAKAVEILDTVSGNKAERNLSNVLNKDFKAKAEAAGVGEKEYTEISASELDEIILKDNNPKLYKVTQDGIMFVTGFVPYFVYAGEILPSADGMPTQLYQYKILSDGIYSRTGQRIVGVPGVSTENKWDDWKKIGDDMFKVSLSMGSDENIVADKTYEEIVAAHNAGKYVYAYGVVDGEQGVILPLITVDSEMVAFSCDGIFVAITANNQATIEGSGYVQQKWFAHEWYDSFILEQTPDMFPSTKAVADYVKEKIKEVGEVDGDVNLTIEDVTDDYIKYDSPNGVVRIGTTYTLGADYAIAGFGSDTIKVDCNTGIEYETSSGLDFTMYYNDINETHKLSNKADKPTYIIPDTETLILTHNQEAHFGEITALTLSMPETIDNLYWSSFCFTSPKIDVATSIIYPAEPIIWVGDDCDADGIFVPEANTRYEVSVKKLGDDIVARVGAY